MNKIFRRTLFLNAKILLSLAISLSSLFIAEQAGASPHPATTTSILTDPEQGLSFRAFGFKLSFDKSTWRPIEKENDSLFAEIQFESKTTPAPVNEKAKGSTLPSRMPAQAETKPEPHKPQISLRMDELSKKQSIESYAKKWMRDYPHYGFEVLGTKTFAHSNGQGLVVDLFHRQNNKQLRQVILLKNKKVAIFTCSNDKSKFSEVLTECNQLVKNFSWLEIDQKDL